MPQLPVMSRGDDPDQTCAALNEHGAVIIADLFGGFDVRQPTELLASDDL